MLLALTIWSGSANLGDQRLRQEQQAQIIKLQAEVHDLTTHTNEEMNSHRCRSEQLLGAIMEKMGDVKPPYPPGTDVPVNCPYVN